MKLNCQALAPNPLAFTKNLWANDPTPPHPITFKHHKKNQRVKLTPNGPPYLSIKNGGHGVVQHVQWVHYQSYLLHNYQNASILHREFSARRTQCRSST